MQTKITTSESSSKDFNSAHNGQRYYFMYGDIMCPALKTLSFLATKIFLEATILQKATSGKLELEALWGITQPVGAMSNSASTMVRHAQQTSAQSQGMNFTRRDFENNSKSMTFSSDTYEQFDYKFIAYYVDFDLKKTIILLVHLSFLSSMLITSSSAKVIAVMLATALLISTSLLAALEDLKRVICLFT